MKRLLINFNKTIYGANNDNDFEDISIISHASNDLYIRLRPIIESVIDNNELTQYQFPDYSTSLTSNEETMEYNDCSTDSNIILKTLNRKHLSDSGFRRNIVTDNKEIATRHHAGQKICKQNRKMDEYLYSFYDKYKDNDDIGEEEIEKEISNKFKNLPDKSIQEQIEKKSRDDNKGFKSDINQSSLIDFDFDFDKHKYIDCNKYIENKNTILKMSEFLKLSLCKSPNDYSTLLLRGLDDNCLRGYKLIFGFSTLNETKGYVSFFSSPYVRNYMSDVPIVNFFWNGLFYYRSEKIGDYQFRNIFMRSFDRLIDYVYQMLKDEIHKDAYIFPILKNALNKDALIKKACVKNNAFFFQINIIIATIKQHINQLIYTILNTYNNHKLTKIKNREFKNINTSFKNILLFLLLKDHMAIDRQLHMFNILCENGCYSDNIMRKIMIVLFNLVKVYVLMYMNVTNDNMYEIMYKYNILLTAVDLHILKQKYLLTRKQIKIIQLKGLVFNIKNMDKYYKSFFHDVNPTEQYTDTFYVNPNLIIKEEIDKYFKEINILQTITTIDNNVEHKFIKTEYKKYKTPFIRDYKDFVEQYNRIHQFDPKYVFVTIDHRLCDRFTEKGVSIIQLERKKLLEKRGLYDGANEVRKRYRYMTEEDIEKEQYYDRMMEEIRSQIY